VADVAEHVHYLDNAATSWPKPPEVAVAMTDWLERVGGSPGRAGHRMAIEAARLLADARIALAELLGVEDPARVVFTKNVTEALNVVLLGLVGPGDHVVTTAIEHNAVMRPLRHLESRGARVTVVPASRAGEPDLDALASALRRPTRLLVTTHASNVIGGLVALGPVVEAAHAAGVPVLVDAAQTAGAVPVDCAALGVDYLAFTGHKALLGPTGTGGLCLAPGTQLEPVLRGGTGSDSELEAQPDFLPDRLESGTLNVVGIAGLHASVELLLARGVAAVRHHEIALGRRLLDGLAELPVTVHGPLEPERRVGLLSVDVPGVSPSEAGLILDERFGVMTRVGLHCAPAAHRVLATYPTGTVRLSWSALSAEADIDAALAALEAIAAGLLAGAER
jgi:cysteine desulfurase / selenocysteine lyase